MINKWSLYEVVKQIAPALGLKSTDLRVLKAHLSVLAGAAVDPSRKTLSYMQVSKLHERADSIAPSTFYRGEKRLDGLGLIRKNMSSNGRRFTLREGSQVVDAYGVDLSPLFTRAEELITIRDEFLRQKQINQNLRTRISCLFHDIKRSFFHISASIAGQISEIYMDLRRFLKRTTQSVAELEEMEDRLIAFRSSLEAGTEAHVEVVKALYLKAPCPTKESSTECQDLQQSATQNACAQPVTQVVDVGQNDRHIESKQKHINKRQTLRHDLIFNPRVLSITWRETNFLSELYDCLPRSEHCAGNTLKDISSQMGIDRETAVRALAVLGWEGFINVLDYLGSKINEIMNPKGYLRSMLNCYEQGQAIAGGRVSRSPR